MALEKFPNPTHTVVNGKKLSRRGKSMYNGICIAVLKINTNSRYFFFYRKNVYCKIKNYDIVFLFYIKYVSVEKKYYDIKDMHVLTKAVQSCQIFN